MNALARFFCTLGCILASCGLLRAEFAFEPSWQLVDYGQARQRTWQWLEQGSVPAEDATRGRALWPSVALRDRRATRQEDPRGRHQSLSDHRLCREPNTHQDHSRHGFHARDPVVIAMSCGAQTNVSRRIANGRNEA